MTNKIPHDMPGGDRSDFCPGCGQYLILEDCTPTKCNATHEPDSYEDHPPGYDPKNNMSYADFCDQIEQERRHDH